MNTLDTLDHWAGPRYSKRARRRWQYNDRAMARRGWL